MVRNFKINTKKACRNLNINVDQEVFAEPEPLLPYQSLIPSNEIIDWLNRKEYDEGWPMYSDSEIVAEVRQQAMPIEEPIEILDSELINEPEPTISSNEAFIF